jgi:hypothetical protein
MHFNHSMREPSVVIPVTAVVDHDGLVHIEGDDVSLVRWNHRPALLRAALDRLGRMADWKPRWHLLAVPRTPSWGVRAPCSTWRRRMKGENAGLCTRADWKSPSCCASSFGPTSKGTSSRRSPSCGAWIALCLKIGRSSSGSSLTRKPLNTRRASSTTIRMPTRSPSTRQMSPSTDASLDGSSRNWTARTKLGSNPSANSIFPSSAYTLADGRVDSTTIAEDAR